ncbi:FAD-binding oxidoreductase [Aphanizomenon flos-aquae NRERC-008]|jgi:glycolate oxidase FAD binding subunit|uniref:FAD-binding oxidoreductase n=1 Tax=Aphanizomenon flos-aquae FACHB-1249 TaxID=2692889 RepID=A0ABR8IXJ4_APHFL|nr:MULTISPECIES: FAD-binding oxidoreductase [Aphanizomenon]MCE2907015.1 FAD-binding oxidoreductase [Anabaena sp. CoA2_C59]MDJ0504431.1 FAD-binding oxidoreductase [Nostocales cyanobacterium LE14-WE12]MBD2392579.1 FAD-binding oxidoreductase [Aphanizomenon flos-aquae FACHB-1171]MBD2558911.1 FAD-binding oxidoreductase [Aphanizomenon flos-aquae FACHB-1290]MBD2633619.1 FAD-binding oxidoreductase [Aphanizomenon sp. FACHB-1399]
MNSIASTLTSILSTENAVISWENLSPTQQHNIQQGIDPKSQPSCVIYPHSQAELAAVITTANSHQWRVLTWGSGSKINWGGLAENIDIIVSTEHINQLIEHAVGDLTVTVEAGMKFAQIQEILAKSGQTLALDPAAPELATIGGIVATADTGSLRQRYGGVRDQLLGITFIRADGEIAKAGGRVVKNVAGYDLMKLFTGAYGTLGIISQVTFRVYPIPESSGTVILTGKPEAISQAARTLHGSELTPTQADLLSNKLLTNLDLGTGIGLIARFQSISESVQEQSKRLLLIGEKLGLQGVIYSGNQEIDLWQQLPKQIYDHLTESTITCKIGVLPTAAVEILNYMEVGLIHISSGLGLVRLEKEEQILPLRSLCQANSGFLSVLSAPVEFKKRFDVWGYNGNALAVMRGIKEQFDGNFILSPGRFVGGI